MMGGVSNPFPDSTPLSDLLRQHELLQRAEETPPVWPSLPEGWTAVGMTEQISWYGKMGTPPPYPLCDVNWGSHGCGRKRGHARILGHRCDPCEGHPWWLHALAYWLGHFTGHWGGCVERWPYYGRKTRFYGEDAP